MYFQGFENLQNKYQNGSNRYLRFTWPGLFKSGLDNPELAWNLTSGLKALKENSVQIFLLAIWSLDVLKRIGKIFS